ncbi:hypothetical protein CKO44_17805 [Rubrivivax gelatinosus]|uniref:DUF1631 family protein n=1 Tax=Rubrivivax gelatinosus TaxID=28068 RepID=A0ABS1DS58_RUBGE|nr:DUF1631 family protein [Rubrivivax gelatinosus]MBK1615317.1 hypothetical protein [Rubrivivax gelatinosus]MBK1711810.1 hypothetical protein [Rubrivivax gelatinosus]
MSPPSIPAALQQFIEDELLRAPLLVDQVVEGTIDRLRQSLPTLAPQPRAATADLLHAIGSHREHLSDYYVRSLKRQLAERPDPMAAFGASALPAALSLVDEDSVSIDVEISHAIEMVRSTAEYELRELQTFTAALVGDMDLARDHNPFGPATHARALWAASQALPLSREHHLIFMRNASPALAQALRRAYAASSSRLESAGVTPAAYRTMILPSGARRSRRPEVSLGAGLDLVRSAVAPMSELGFDLGEPDFGGLALEPAAAAPAAPPAAERRAIETLTGLFDAMLADRRLAADIALMLSRLQSAATRLVLRDPGALDDESHPMWRFIDALAFTGEVLPPAGNGERAQTLRFAQGLVEHLAAEPVPAAPLFEWAGERLLHQGQHRFARRCTAAAGQIAELQRLETRLCSSAAPPSTLGGALDIAQLDTVPADLMPADGPSAEPRDALAWLQARRPGEWLNAFLQGRWVKAQILWPGELGELWLLADAESPETWAVRRRAMTTLHAERLLSTLRPRSLVRSAAKRVMRRTIKLG